LRLVRRGRKRKVFGIGLSRTATTSLNAALDRLGLRSIHFPSDPRTRREVLGQLANARTRLRLSVLRSCDALTDTPVCSTFEALDAGYPGSRFVLTVRDKEAWLRSCETYWGSGLGAFLRDQPEDPYAIYMAAIGQALYGSVGFDRERFSRAYDAYGERVASHFRGREHDLLVLDVFSGQGWSELCGFLGLAAPAEPFPFENRTPSGSPASAEPR
jgi:Sulfotransferase domain